MLGERISVLKVVSVIVCTAGALLLMVPDLVDKDKKKDQNSNPIGYVLVVVSTILYACWEVCYKKFAKMGYDKKDQQSKSGVHKNEKEKENKKEKKESEKEGADIKNNENGFSAHSGDEEDDIDNDDETRPFLSNNHNHNDNKHNSINYNAEEDEEEEEEGKNFSSKNLESGMTNKTMTTTTSSTQPQKEEPSSKSAVWAQLRLLEETLLFLGLVGVYTLLLSWPGIIVVHYAGFEKFELPTGNALYGIIITMGLDSLFNILLMLAIFLSSPLFISVGSLMTIPASVLADYVFHDEVLAPVAYGGMACIISGFLGMSLSEYITHIEHKLPERRRNLIKRLL
jgi:drug/metabolite transporter (DMT)-like permease